MTLTKPGVPIILEDIFGWVREGNALQVRYWLDDTEHDLNQGDDHGFSLLHWAAKEGHSTIVEMLILRGARVNATNMGDDTALHLAAAHGHRDIVVKLLSKKADVNAVNEHGNTPLHYACFWSYEMIIEDLIRAGALVTIANKYDELAADKCRPDLGKRIFEFAAQFGQDPKQRVSYRDQSYRAGSQFGGSGTGTMGGTGGTGTMRTRTRDATLSRYSGVELSHLRLQTKVASGHSGELWKGTWQGNEIVARILALREVTPRIARDFVEEFPRLRIFSHPNVSPVLACCSQAPNLAIVSQLMPYGSLYDVLHERTDVVVDHARALKFAIDIARGMAFLHSLDPLILRYYLNSKHVVVDEELTAKINMADTKFSFQEKGRLYNPAWMSPEALQKRPEQMNVRAADIWSFAVLLWELNTREVPFADLSPMEIGMKIALEGLRIQIPPGLGRNMSRLITLCMNEDTGKRPNFDQILPILEKMMA